MPESRLHILISPLDWGLGHAARCIPVIRELLQVGHKVTIAGSGRSVLLLKKEFPELETIELPGFSPSYSRSGKMALHLFLLLPQFILSIIREHRMLNKLIKQFHFDIVISDNRYGLWNRKVRSLLITHQVMIKTPSWLRFAEYPVYRISRFFITHFDECWIPDSKESPGLSGDLSHKYSLPGNATFIGALSRFERSGNSPNSFAGDGKIVAIISGPEPQRSIFEDMVTLQLRELNLPSLIISGKPESAYNKIIENNLTIVPYMATEELKSLLISSSLVICRSGYSSIMDLSKLGIKALFVPTPGQTEQLYLAGILQLEGVALWRTQKELNLGTDIAEAQKYKGFAKHKSISGLNEAILGLKKK
jgi:UDP:flavonoid glycosyltransferase YjiC (YdhE family)